MTRGLGALAAQILDRFEGIGAGHFDVHQHDIRPRSLHFVDEILRGAESPYELQVSGKAQAGLKPLDEKRVIIHAEYSNWIAIQNHVATPDWILALRSRHFRRICGARGQR